MKDPTRSDTKQAGEVGMMRMETVVAVALLGAGLLVWMVTPPGRLDYPASERPTARVILAQPSR